MQCQRNYYQILGVPNDATQVDIKKKYRELARQFHPDLVVDKRFGQTVFVQVNQAYRVLSDPDRRAHYDEQLRQLSIEEADRDASLKAIVEIDRKVRDADIALMNGDLRRARSLCEAVIASAPRHSEALRVLGDALAEAKHFTDAIETYRMVQEISPSYTVDAKLRQLEAIVLGEGRPFDTNQVKEAIKQHPIRRMFGKSREPKRP